MSGKRANRQANQALQRSTRANVRKVYTRIGEQERMKLEFLVKQGLPTDCAGKIIGMSSRNSNRIMKGRAEEKAEFHRHVTSLSPAQQVLAYRSRASQKRGAHVEGLLALMKARDDSRISKRNLLKMERKVDLFIDKFIAQQEELGLENLAAKVRERAREEKSHRHLPSLFQTPQSFHASS